MPRHWRFASHDRAVVTRLAGELDCSYLLAQVLASRGIENGVQGRQFLVPKRSDLHAPELLPGANEAADRIVAAVRAQRRITVYGDYDVDGVTATSILWHCLKLAGAQVDYYIPCRMEEGYGLNLDAIRTLHEEDPNRLVVTVDCGICSLEEAALARSLGLELIITDHHTMTDALPDSAVNVHPRLPNSQYPFPEICGAGVAFKVAWAISQRLGDGTKASPRMREFLKSAMGLAAMGTVADVMPLIGENRVLVRYGLMALAENQAPGLEMLLKVAGINKAKRLSTEDIAFGLAPRLNAAGRLGQARLAVELLTTDSRSRAAQLADYVDQLNKNRQTVERKMFKEAKSQVEEHPEWANQSVIVTVSDDWHPGVVGIVASRLAEQFHKPSIVLSLNRESRIAQGSGRSFQGFDLHKGLSACSDLLEGFGGHRAAAGLRIREDQIDAFREQLSAHATECPTASGGAEPEVQVDAEVSLHDLTNRAVHELESLGPFGAQHRRPIFSSSRVELAEPPTTMGGGGRHLSLRVREADKVVRCIAFGKGDWAADLGKIAGPFSICFSVGFNSFRGQETVELQMIDWNVNAGRNAASQVAESVVGST